jgi:hypothetical protein
VTATRAGRLADWLTPERTTFVAAVLGLAVVACLMPAQADTWWQLRAGQDIVASGQVSLVDRYSYTAAGQPWPDHEWLWQVVTYGLYRAGGMPLLTAVCAALIVAAFVLASSLAEGPFGQRLGLFVLAVMLCGPGAGVRPQLFTLLALMTTVVLVVRRREWALPPLFLLWANMHGAVVLGGVVLAAATALAAVRREGRRLARLAAASAASGALMLITPLGRGLFTFIGESMERSRENDITEWRSALQWAPRPLAFCVAAALLVLLAARRWRRLSGFADHFVVICALLFVPIAGRAVRNIGAFALLALPAASRLLTLREGEPDRVVGRVQRFLADLVSAAAGDARPSRARDARNLVLMAVAGAVFVGVAWSRPLDSLDWNPVSPAAAATIRACPGRVFNEYSEGGYLIWFVPAQPVFIDGRQDPYSLEFLRRANFAHGDRTARAALFAQYGIRCAALSPRSLLAPVLRAEGWSESYADERWVVLTRPRS